MDDEIQTPAALKFRAIDFRVRCAEGCGYMARRVVHWLDAEEKTIQQRELCLLHSADAEKRARKVGVEIR